MASSDRVTFRTQILNRHLRPSHSHTFSPPVSVSSSPCLSYIPPDLTEPASSFDTKEMRALLDAHNIQDRDWLFNLMIQSNLFNPKLRGHRVFVCPDYNQSMEQQREINMRRIEYLLDRGVFKGWLTDSSEESELRKVAFNERGVVHLDGACVGFSLNLLVSPCDGLKIRSSYPHSSKRQVLLDFRGGAIQFFGTKRHHDKWLKVTEDLGIKGCFSMTELGHGSNVRGIETVTTYDPHTGEFVINTPCESAQKYWIGGAAKHATHTIVFSQLKIEGKDQGVHAFIVPIRDSDGNVYPNIRIADCGHKIGLNGVDNGRIWFDNVHIPRENLLNSVADVSPDGQYLSAIKDPDQRFAAFLAPLTSGRVMIAVTAIYISKIGLAIAIRYALSRRAFSLTPNEPEVLLLDYPSHQRRLFPLLAKTYAMTFAGNHLKSVYVKRTPETNKIIHVLSSGLKATLTWHNMRTLQECREACGGQGLKTENRVGNLKAEFDVQSTFEGDNNVLMQQVSKALLGEYLAARKQSRAFKGLWLEHMNEPSPVILPQLTSSSLRSSQFQTDIFFLRERDLLNRFVAEVAAHQKQGRSKEHAFVLGHLLAEDLGRAFADKAILLTFIEAEANVSTGPLKNAAAAREEVMKLCSELRPHALALVSSFGIPGAFLSPIAFDWIEANSWPSSQQVP
ncbi:hypothetical protein Cgig2_021406 [Carnegiea gigantea]|uniref:Acyl-coenzyme A oxidase n=1 Tax=Carnegiea gigantea TaxID=171969 RepID=A0A9Q1JNN9_9CARY|nr:hypothetical protein Cgig2_021406 [Carnegiea gigantea]